MATNETLRNQTIEQGELPAHEIATHQERLSVEREQGVERMNEKKEHSAEAARHEIEKITAEHEPRTHESVAEKPIEHKTNSKAARKNAYNSIMQQTRAEMSGAERAFSRVIHNPVIERASDFASNTIARPDAILSGAIFAFILTLVIYLIAKQSGYPLTGTEATAAFIIGWAIGNIYDFTKTLLRGR